MKKWTLGEALVLIAEAVVILFVLIGLCILFVASTSDGISSADAALVLATMALSIATFLLARYSGDLSEMERKRAHRISIENSEKIGMKILAEGELESISQSLSRGNLPAPQYQYARELLENLPAQEKELKKLAAETLNTMDAAVYGTEANRIINAGEAQNLYSQLRDKMKDAVLRWRQEL